MSSLGESTEPHRPRHAEGRLAVVVGASSGIGAEIGRTLSKDYSVLLVARRTEQLRVLAEEIGASYLTVDVTAESSIALIGDWIRERAVTPALVVYCAGILHAEPVVDMKVEIWDSVMSVNLRGAFLTARELAPLMSAGGRLVFVSSIAADKGRFALAAYAASKAGLDRFAESLASEVEPRGIAVNVVAPGPTRTAMLDRPDAPHAQLDARRVADVVDWLSRLPADVVIRKISVVTPTAGPTSAAAIP